MDRDRQAIEEQRRQQRAQTATGHDAQRLAEVESAVIAAAQEIADTEAELRASGRYAETYIDEQVEQRRAQARAYIDKLKQDVVDPIASKIETQAQELGDVLPERTARHIEASEHYRRLDSDKRQEAISRAITGKDDILAEALLTGRDPLTDITREQLMKRLRPPETDQQRADVMAIAERVQATINTMKGARP